MIRSRIIIRKVIIVLVLMISFILTINHSESFAKILSLDLESLKIYIPDSQEEDNGNVNEGEENSESNDGKNIIEDGVYTIACAKDSNYVLDIAWNSLDWGGNLQICNRNGGSNQKFYISYEGDEYYKISNINSALILDVKNGEQDNGVNIQQWEDNSSSAQRWKINKNLDGTYTFVSKCSGKALDVDGAIFEEGRNIQQYDINNTDAQKFKLEETNMINEGIVSIRKVDNVEKVIEVKENSSEEGKEVQLYEKNGSLAQRFEIHKVKDNEVRIRTMSSGGWLTEEKLEEGSSVIQFGDSSTPVNDANTWIIEWNDGITFKNKESGLYLDIDGNRVDNGTKIQVYKGNNNQESQRFLVINEDLLGGWYEIKSALGTYIDLDNAGSDWGTNIHMWTRNGQNNQKFKFTKSGEGYLITTLYGLAFDVENGSMENGANVRQWEDNGSTCQRWKVEVLDGGYIKFINCNSGKYLDVANGNSEAGANVQQYEGNNSKAQLWNLTSTSFASGWFSENGSMYCVDPVTGQLVKNCTRVDPMMQDSSQYGSIYDFDSEGRATWHLPTVNDLSGGTGPSAPIPTLTGDRRQRVIQLALSRLGCPYEGGNAPTGFVCDGLTSWSYTTALGDWFYTGAGAREDLQDASWQWEKIKNRNGIKYDRGQLRSGDFVFFGNPQVTQGPGMIDYSGQAYHAGIYYKDDIMINARSGGVDLYSVSGYYMSWLGGGSPYESETSRVEIHH